MPGTTVCLPAYPLLRLSFRVLPVTVFLTSGEHAMSTLPCFSFVFGYNASYSWCLAHAYKLGFSSLGYFKLRLFETRNFRSFVEYRKDFLQGGGINVQSDSTRWKLVSPECVFLGEFLSNVIFLSALAFIPFRWKEKFWRAKDKTREHYDYLGVRDSFYIAAWCIPEIIVLSFERIYVSSALLPDIIMACVIAIGEDAWNRQRSDTFEKTIFYR